MNKAEEHANEYVDVEDLKRYMSLSVEEKLNYLEEMNSFLKEAMPVENKRAWEELKKMGW